MSAMMSVKTRGKADDTEARLADAAADAEEVALDDDAHDAALQARFSRGGARRRSSASSPAAASSSSSSASCARRLPCSRAAANVAVLALAALLVALALVLIVVLAQQRALPASRASAALVAALVQRSMLHEARTLIAAQRNDGREWRAPYGEGQGRDLIEKDRGDVWLDLYPASVVPLAHTSVLNTMGDPSLWHHLQDLGVTVIHLNPVRRSGGLTPELVWTPTTDGGYDRVSLAVDPLYGSDADYRALVRTAAQYNGYIAGDIVPGHTGTGADWLLAKMNYQDYPYLFHMIEIKPHDWSLLPHVPPGQDAVNVSPALERTLAELDYIDGVFDVVIFKSAGVKDTNWAVTGEVVGVDGVARRWVYLHLFKQGQPTLNWLHPSFTAHELVVGDLLKTLVDLGAKIVRFDANSLLGTERVADDSTHAKSLFHPLSAVSTQLLAMTVRKLGGYSYEENSILSRTLARLGQATTFGPDLSYDFTLRGGWLSALLTGDVRLLKLQLALMRTSDVGRGQRAIHSLQNHDELVATFNYDESSPDELFPFGDKMMRAVDINAVVVQQNFAAASADGVRLGEYGGLSTTLTTLVAGRLDIDLRSAAVAAPSALDLQRIVNGSLTLAAFNALQPGLFQVSAWDLVGALQLDSRDVDPALLADGDLRWLNRGAYDLLGSAPPTSTGVTGLPRAHALFGALPAQLAQPLSYASQLKALLRVRNSLRIALGELLPDVSDSIVAGANTNSSDAAHVLVVPTLLPQTPALPGGNVTRVALLFVNWSTSALSATLPLTTLRLGDRYVVDTRVDAHEVWPDEARLSLAGAALRVALPPLGSRLVVVTVQ